MPVAVVNPQPNHLDKFTLLMWKNFLQQWRHKFQTLMEFVLPLSTMSLLLFYRAAIKPHSKTAVSYEEFPANSLNFSLSVLAGMNLTELTIVYSPKNSILENIVSTALAKMFANNIKYFPDVNNYLPNADSMPIDMLIMILKSYFTVKGYRKSTDLLSIYGAEENTRIVIAAVEFSDSLYGKKVLPNNMHYTLRFPERPRIYSFYGKGSISWFTDIVYPVEEKPGPRCYESKHGGIEPGYTAEMFIALQYFITSEIILKMTKKNVEDFQINMRRFPHHTWTADSGLKFIKFILPLLIVFSYSYTAVNIVRAIVVEKEKQLKEHMSVMGLSTWMHWCAWFWKQIIYLTLSVICMIMLLKINWFRTDDTGERYCVLVNTPPFLLFCYIMLYMATAVCFCFLLSCLCKTANTATLVTGILWFVTFVPSFLMSMNTTAPYYIQVIACLLFNSALTFGLQMIVVKENVGGIQWSDIKLYSPDMLSNRILFGHVVLMLIVDAILYMLITLYLEQVLPGPFGTTQPWNFLLKRQYWQTTYTKAPGLNRVDMSKRTLFSDLPVKEEEPTGHEIGVKIHRLTKIFGKHVAVNNVTLNIYTNQITVLLGHNGAGKTTTLGMITGNIEMSRGTIILAGFDLQQTPQLARAQLGFCPQHNVLFDELTVKEHLEFYTRLKGFSGPELDEEIRTLIMKLELLQKSNTQSRALSGGQKRRLQVGIALCGRARVVLLDEPTSGMDPASRRALWDLLQREKKDRSMILSTHFMDEADILGDRIAILANGRLVCIGTPYFLKREFGVGYTLIIDKDDGFQSAACTTIIQKHVPEANIKEDCIRYISYILPNIYTNRFAALFADLEQSIDDIKYKDYGLSATTLEDVFMRVGADLSPLPYSSAAANLGGGAGVTPRAGKHISQTKSKSEIKIPLQRSLLRLKKVYKRRRYFEVDPSPTDLLTLNDINKAEYRIQGLQLILQHVKCVWKKLWIIWTRSWQMILLMLAVPIIALGCNLTLVRYLSSLSGELYPRELSLERGYPRTETLLRYVGSIANSTGGLTLAAYQKYFKRNKEMKLTTLDEPIDTFYLKRTKHSADLAYARRSLLIGAEIGDDSATCWFSNFGYHDIATSLATIQIAILKANKPAANLRVFNYPLIGQYRDQSNMQVIMALLAMKVGSGMGISTSLISSVFIMFYIKENACKALLIQQASGIRPATLWFSTYIFDWIWFLITFIPLALICIYFDVSGLTKPYELGRLFVCYMVYGLAMLPGIYFCSKYFTGSAYGFATMFFSCIVFGMMSPQIVQALIQNGASQILIDVLDTILRFHPLYSFTTAVMKLNKIGMITWSCLEICESLIKVSPNITKCNMDVMCKRNPEECCIRQNAYFDWEEPGVLRYIFFIILSGIILWVVLLVCEYKLLLILRRRQRKPPPLKKEDIDSDVWNERLYVCDIVRKNHGNNVLVADGITKYYRKKFLAVNQVSFTVAHGDCFGLLGINGAGKTTTFKMLMGDESISAGDAYICQHSVKKSVTKVYHHIGYCPQFDALFDEFTGRETLEYYCLLRGFRKNEIHKNIQVLARLLGFTRHLDKQVHTYSGGNQRKLSTAVALIGDTSLIFVDEPTTGVDAAAKRQVWAALQEAQKAGRGVVLTSHSMEECEALCTRLTIMVGGEFKCLGTPQHLKNKFSQGLTLTIKIEMAEDIKDNYWRTGIVKEYVQKNFDNFRLMEEYQGLVTYYLQEKGLSWSEAFGIMESAKKSLPIEDYTLSQTTLEQIFLQFTKFQRNPDE